MLPQIKAKQKNREIRPMRVRGTGAKTILIGSLLSFCSPLIAHHAAASVTPRHRSGSHAATAHHAAAAYHVATTHHASTASHRAARVALHGKTGAAWRHVARGGGISCVPFARNDSGISVAGNAWQWWDHAAGVYARGRTPEPGSVLAFRANPRMHLGHVAVVSRVINPREVEIDHANWAGAGMHGGVAHNVPVVDVSEANDWSAVRVGLGRSGDFGSVYPTYGFIYDRPDNGVAVAAAGAPSPQPALNPAPGDLRPVAERPWQTYEEVAQAPVQPTTRPGGRGLDLRISSAMAVGAIDRK
jgi:surface antigen